MYSECQAKVKWGHLMTEGFNVTVGLKQGCVLSPTLFALYIKELGDKLTRSGLGIKVGDISIPGLFFADDMVLIAESESDLQKLLDIVGDFAKNHKMIFSGSKSKILHLHRRKSDKIWYMGGSQIGEGEDYQVGVEEDVVIDINGTEDIQLDLLGADAGLVFPVGATVTIETSPESQPPGDTPGDRYRVPMSEEEEYRYLGINVSSEGRCFRHHIEQIKSKAKRLAGLTQAQCKISWNKPVVGKLLWELVYKPAITYGMAVFICTRKDIDDLETIQLKLGGQLLGVSDKAPREGVLSELKWKKMEITMLEKRLLFYNFVLSLDNKRWDKILLDEMLIKVHMQTPWYKQVRKDLTMIKADLTKEEDKIGRDNSIRKSTAEYNHKIWLDGMSKKSTLALYKFYNGYRGNIWLSSSSKSRLFTQARIGDLPLRHRTCHWDGTTSDCKWCPGVKETVTHFIAECSFYNWEREELIVNLKKLWSPAVSLIWEGIPSVEEQTASLLGLIGKTSLQQIILVQNYIHKIWEKREEHINGS